MLTLKIYQKSKCSHNIFEGNRINKDKNNDSLHEEKGIEDLSNKVVVIGDSMLSNINSRGLSKLKEVDVLNFPGATSSDVLTKIDDVLNKKPASLIVRVGTNDLTSNMNLLWNVKKIVNKTNKTSPKTVLTFSNIIFRKDRNNLEKTRADTNSRWKNFCRQKDINLISNDNIKEEYLGIKKRHLNRKGNGIFAKNLLNFIEGNWDVSLLRDSYYETENASKTIISNAKGTLRDIRTSNFNRLVFGHLNINLPRTKFDFLCEQIEGSIDVFMIAQSKLDDSFPHG